MRFKPLFFLFFLCFFTKQVSAENAFAENNSVILITQSAQSGLWVDERRPNPILKLVHKGSKLNRKATAAILAFPFPFGIVGLHRIYLGSAPYVPVVYIGSLGGIFGLLPLIDFIVILTEKDVEKFANSGKVFMWIE